MYVLPVMDVLQIHDWIHDWSWQFMTGGLILINKPRGGNAVGFFQQVFGNDHSCILKCRCLSKLLSSFVMVFWLCSFAMMFVTAMALKFHLCFEGFCGDFFLFFLLLLRWLLFIVV